MKGTLVNGARALTKAISKNSPMLCAIGAAVGVGVTAYAAWNASKKVHEELEQREYDEVTEGGELTTKDKAKIVVKHTWPVAVCGGLTVAMIFTGNSISDKRLRITAAAAEMYRTTFTTYQDKVKEKIGAKKEREIRDDILVDEAKKKGVGADPALVRDTGEGNVLFVDSITGQAFRSSVDYLRKREAQFNEDLGPGGEDWLSINTWLYSIGLREVDNCMEIGDVLGFNAESGLHIYFTASNDVTSTGETATLIGYEDPPCFASDWVTPSRRA